MKALTRRSNKRDAILEVLRSTKRHPSVDWIYRELKPRFPDLSLGTVYRNISVFKEEGLIAAVGTVAGQERYDGDTSEHHHMLCRRCGSVVDVSANVTIDGVEPDDCVIESCRIVFHGLCPECSSLKNKLNGGTNNE
ncbi:MAG: transcriptional repressor [Oscillospiraceae bacterium]|jgi:Fur family peroxide stress response transcriptional regulator|nr:transcriptional repressor [Oscillospiraceae bacterium]